MALAPLLSGCGGAPQIIAYSPDRGALDVRTSASIVIQFDRAVDRQSVAARFSLQPAATGRVTWASDRKLVYVHSPLRTSTEYHVLLRAGYRSAGGGANDLDHTWSFTTEGPLQITGWSPGPGDQGVDPATYLAVTFNHPIAAAGLAQAFALEPHLPLDALVDPGDRTRALIVPRGLLEPDQTYTLHALTSLRDADGNPLVRAAAASFQTGAVRPLRGWLSYLLAPPGSSRAPGSVWMVDSNRVPRQLVPGPVLAYTWSPQGDELAVETAARTWSDLPLGGAEAPLNVAADWVEPLGANRGFAVLDGGSLALLTPAGQRVDLASGVDSATLNAAGTQIAYTVTTPTSVEIWALNVELRSRYLVQAEAGSVLGLAWSPDGLRLAYEVIEGGASRIKVRTLTQSAAITAATGQVSDPAWDADSAHLFVLALGGSPVQERIYRIAVGGSPQAVGGASGLPGAGGLDAGPPVVSTDGRQVAFLSGGAAGQELWLMNADGTGLTRLTGPAYSCRQPSWTPA